MENGATSRASSEMNVNNASTRSSMIDMTLSALDDEDAIEEKIIKDAENKICKSVAINSSKDSQDL